MKTSMAQAVSRRTVSTAIILSMVAFSVMASSNDHDQEEPAKKSEVYWPKTLDDCYNATLWEYMDFSSLDPEIYGYEIYRYTPAQNCSNYLRKRPDKFFVFTIIFIGIFFSFLLVLFAVKYRTSRLEARRENHILTSRELARMTQDTSNVTVTDNNNSPPSYTSHTSYEKKDPFFNKLPTYDEAVSHHV